MVHTPLERDYTPAAQLGHLGQIVPGGGVFVPKTELAVVIQPAHVHNVANHHRHAVVGATAEALDVLDGHEGRGGCVTVATTATCRGGRSGARAVLVAGGDVHVSRGQVVLQDVEHVVLGLVGDFVVHLHRGSVSAQLATFAYVEMTTQEHEQLTQFWIKKKHVTNRSHNNFFMACPYQDPKSKDFHQNTSPTQQPNEKEPHHLEYKKIRT
jgi:formylglycine-generating enzyme required for sulfatase activity